MNMSMYQRAMGDRYERLSDAVQRFHRLTGRHVLHGRVKTDAPGSLPAKILALCLGTPRKGCNGPILFELDASQSVKSGRADFRTR